VFLPPIIEKKKIHYRERLSPSTQALVWWSYILSSLDITPKWSQSEWRPCAGARGQKGRVKQEKGEMHSSFKLFGLRKHMIWSLFRTFFMLLSPFVSCCQTLFVRPVFPFEPAPL
jgi:hypothetical protein